MKKQVFINKEAKEYLMEYLDNWIQELSKYPFSYRKGIVRAIQAKIDSIPVQTQTD